METVLGVPLESLPEGCQPVDIIAIVRALDENGDPCVYFRQSEGLAPWERMGLLNSALHMAEFDDISSIELEGDGEESDDLDGLP